MKKMMQKILWDCPFNNIHENGSIIISLPHIRPEIGEERRREGWLECSWCCIFDRWQDDLPKSHLFHGIWNICTTEGWLCSSTMYAPTLTGHLTRLSLTVFISMMNSTVTFFIQTFFIRNKVELSLHTLYTSTQAPKIKIDWVHQE